MIAGTRVPTNTVPRWKVAEQLAQKNGHSNVISVNGSRYDGEWKNNKREGIGHQILAKSGREYEGEWKNDMRHGRGTLWVPIEGSQNAQLRALYEGDWRLNKMHGVGVYYYDGGGCYHGEWRNNERSGKGTMMYANGDRYEGEWECGMRHGEGVFTTANNQYSGGWYKDKKEGKGSFLYSSSMQQYDGEWRDDIPKCGVLIDCKVGKEKHEEDNNTAKIPPCLLANPEIVLEGQHIKLETQRKNQDLNFQIRQD